MTVYLPVLPSHCTRARFTVAMSCSDDLAVHSRPFLCMQRQVVTLTTRLFYCWSLLRNNNTATNFKGSFEVMEGVLPHVTVESRHIW